MARWLLTIDQDTCVGSGTCTAIAPDYFTLDEEDRSRGRAGPLAPLPELLEAARLCPTGAIDVVDADTGKSHMD